MVFKYVSGYTINEISKFIINNTIQNYNIILKLNYKDKIKKALSIALCKNIVPGDVHTNNIIIQEDGEIVIVDVGLFQKENPKYINKKEKLKQLLNSLYISDDIKIMDCYICNL